MKLLCALLKYCFLDWLDVIVLEHNEIWEIIHAA